MDFRDISCASSLHPFSSGGLLFPSSSDLALGRSASGTLPPPQLLIPASVPCPPGPSVSLCPFSSSSPVSPQPAAPSQSVNPLGSCCQASTKAPLSLDSAIGLCSSSSAGGSLAPPVFIYALAPPAFVSALALPVLCSCSVIPCLSPLPPSSVELLFFVVVKAVWEGFH